MTVAKMQIGTGKKYSETPFFAGLNGVDGINGLNGKDGEKGETGSAGKDGLNGKDGVNGKDGKDGESADHEAVVALQTLTDSLKTSLSNLQTQPWSIVTVLPNPLPTDIEIGIPLTRNGIMNTLDFLVYGIFKSSTPITVKQNGNPIGTLSITKLGKNPLTFSNSIVGSLGDAFSYVVGGEGLKEAIVVCEQKWVNR